MVTGLIGIRFVDFFFASVSVFAPEMERKMEKTIGMRIRECRVKMGMTQDELAEALLTKKSTISAYENDKIDIKISILKQIAALLGTTIAYLADGEKTEIGEDVMQVALLLQGMQNEIVGRGKISANEYFDFRT